MIKVECIGLQILDKRSIDFVRFKIAGSLRRHSIATGFSLWIYKKLFHTALAKINTVSKVMQLIKCESAFWFNKQGSTKQKLEWQDEYFAVSVSESQIETVRKYNKNQEEHHMHKTFQQEYDEFIIKYGFRKFAD